MASVRGLLRWFWRLEEYNLPDFTGYEPCVYVVKDPASRPTPIQSWPTKAIQDNLVLKIDWTVWAASDAIVASTWDVDYGFVTWDTEMDAIYTTIYVGLGSNHRTYAMRNTVTLDSGAEYTQEIKFHVDEKEPVAPPAYGPGGAELACI